MNTLIAILAAALFIAVTWPKRPHSQDCESCKSKDKIIAAQEKTIGHMREIIETQKEHIGILQK